MPRSTSLRAIDEELLQPLFRKYSAIPPPIVHYTSVETLGMILSSGKLRMTHFRHLNDSTEMLHGRRIANELLEIETRRGNGTSVFFDYCRFLFNDVDDTAIQYFVASFSANDDSPELWAGYGGRGTGVAIVFDTLRMGAEVLESSPYHIAKVAYSDSDQLQLISPLIYAVRQRLAPYGPFVGRDLLDPVILRVAAKLCSHINHHSISLKERKWKPEREWRTVFSLLRTDPEERKACVEYRLDGRPFIDVRVLSVAPDNLLMPILKVRAGDAADIAQIRETLEKYGYGHVPIERSRIAADKLPSWPPEFLQPSRKR